MSSNAKLSFLQVRVETGKIFTLQLLQECAEFEVHILILTAIPDMAASLYEGRRTVHSLQGLGVDDKDIALHGPSF